LVGLNHFTVPVAIIISWVHERDTRRGDGIEFRRARKLHFLQARRKGY
jgi:hypothetical protein